MKIAYQYKSNQCGIACISMLLSHYGVRQDIRKLESYAISLGVLTKAGISPRGICTVLRCFGVTAEYDIAQWGLIKQQGGINILFIHARHYALLSGQERPDKAMIYDPIFGTINVDSVKFEDSQELLIIKVPQKDDSLNLRNPLGSHAENHFLLRLLLFLYSRSWIHVYKKLIKGFPHFDYVAEIE